MGKYEASSQRAAAPAGDGKKKKHIGLWITLAVLAVVVCWGVWFFTTPPDQNAVNNGNAVTDPDSQQGQNQAGSESEHHIDAQQPEVQQPAEKEMKKGYYTILLAGTVDSYNTDTMMLCSVDSEAGKVKLVSINRDTQVDAPIQIPKINAMYGWKNGGDEGAQTMCEKVTEVTGIPINYYVTINMNSFIKIVDLIGGVDYNVPFDMVHRDAQEKFDINLKAGQQNLNGREALQFVRYRSTAENDFGRVNRQKDFLVAAVKQVLKKFSVTQIEDYIQIFSENVVTNMSVQNMLWFFTNVVTGLDFDEDVTSDTLPYYTTGYWTNPNAERYGTQSYVYLDPQQIVEYVNANINPYTTDITVDDVNIPRWINP